MGQLQNQNPQMFQMINQARNNGTNPEQFLKQMMGDKTPEQMQQVLKRQELKDDGILKEL